MYCTERGLSLGAHSIGKNWFSDGFPSVDHISFNKATLLVGGGASARYCALIITVPKAVLVEFNAFAELDLNSKTRPLKRYSEKLLAIEDRKGNVPPKPGLIDNVRCTAKAADESMSQMYSRCLSETPSVELCIIGTCAAVFQEVLPPFSLYAPDPKILPPPKKEEMAFPASNAIFPTGERRIFRS